MLQRLRSRLNREEGFTLIELLVVILIIGILAAIAIPSFLNQTDKGDDAAAMSAARTAQTTAETYFTTERSYASMTLAALQGIESSLPDDLTVAGPDGTGSPSDTAYSVTATSESGNTFTIAKTDGDVTYSCTTKGEGSCPSDGNWGPQAGETGGEAG